jgi:cold-inducible RNA-binding protein
MNRKLHVSNLSFKCDEDALREHFAADGRKVLSVNVPVDRETGRSRGFGFVEMATLEDAAKAIAALHGKDFQGKALSVSESREAAPRPARGPGGRRSS